MTQLKNISEHRPKNMIIDVVEDDAKLILKTGEFIESIKENLIVEKKVEKKPDESWTEEEIDEWVEKNVPNIKYYPTKHSKNYILGKLKENKII